MIAVKKGLKGQIDDQDLVALLGSHGCGALN